MKCGVISLKFCPKCETRLKPKSEENIELCPKCGFSSNKDNETTVSKSPSTSQKYEHNSNSVKVMDSNALDVLPTTNVECPRCKNDVAFWWMLQTRSADEATTQFYRCTKCNHTWRNYA
jgi:transcription factor S